MLIRLTLVATMWLVCTQFLPADDAVRVVLQEKAKKAAHVESTRYLRPSGRDRFVTECTFTVVRTFDGMTIKSVTERGKINLTVEASYDERKHLNAAKATLAVNEKTTTAIVTVTAGKAQVARAELPDQAFDVPTGVIVTSAPDWTDTFLLCKRFDRVQGGKQTFPGLWIHPEQNGQRLTFAIERRGADVIQHAGKPLTLDRFTIWLRGNSSYTAWANADGTMIRLVPMPFKEGALTGIVRDGYEKSASVLRP
jgi:hypothetical protein